MVLVQQCREQPNSNEVAWDAIRIRSGRAAGPFTLKVAVSRDSVLANMPAVACGGAGRPRRAGHRRQAGRPRRAGHRRQV